MGYYTSAEVPFSRRRQPGTPFVKPSVRQIHIAHRRCEQGFQGAQHLWHTTLVQSLVCYTLPEVYSPRYAKSPMLNTLTARTWNLMLPQPSWVLVTNPDRQCRVISRKLFYERPSMNTQLPFCMVSCKSSRTVWLILSRIFIEDSPQSTD